MRCLYSVVEAQSAPTPLLLMEQVCIRLTLRERGVGCLHGGGCILFRSTREGCGDASVPTHKKESSLFFLKSALFNDGTFWEKRLLTRSRETQCPQGSEGHRHRSALESAPSSVDPHSLRPSDRGPRDILVCHEGEPRRAPH